jgi:hypothetical protein
MVGGVHHCVEQMHQWVGVVSNGGERRGVRGGLNRRHPGLGYGMHQEEES